MKEIKTGITGHAEAIVTKDSTALAVGSGSLEVFSTPMMTALMEKAACNAVSRFLENDETTVGTMLNITHDKAVLIGKLVKATAEITDINGRELTFKITAEDENGIIGQGTHKRFVVYAEKFMKKLS